MSWASALSPWQWALLAAIPPAVLMLYFLKLRRVQLEVPSTFLWKRSVEDLHVNSLWQKLKTSLLLLLQMLFLAAVILACFQPGFRSKESVDGRLIFLIDNSASMSARTDASTTRLELAKELVAERINAMSRSNVAMVLAFNDRADVRQGFTNDRRKLLAALDSIQPTNRTTSVDEALRAAAGLANPGRVSFDTVNDYQVAEAVPAELFLVSDGGFRSVPEFDLGNLSAEYIPVGNLETDNVAITAFSVERVDSDETPIEAFGRIANYSTEVVDATCSIYRDDVLLDATEFSVEPDGETGITFQLGDLPPGELRLEIDRDDELELDNVAYAAIRPDRERDILLVTPGNSALQTAFTTPAVAALARVDLHPPEYLISEEYKTAVEQSKYDFVIFDQCVPDVMPPANCLMIGEIPSDGRWTASELQGPLFVLDVDRLHPLVEFLEMGAVRIVEGRSLEPPEGGRVLMRSDFGPIFAIAPRGPFQDAVLGFKIVNTTEADVEVNTDWAIKRSFPVFAFSATKFLAGGVTTAAADSVQPGQPIGMILQNEISNYAITNPTKRIERVSRGAQSQLVYTKTDELGVYEVRPESSDDLLELFSVNLFSQAESDIRVAENIELGAEIVSSTDSVVPKRTELWRWVLLGGLGMLLLEWIVYNRRVFV